MWSAVGLASLLQVLVTAQNIRLLPLSDHSHLVQGLRKREVPTGLEAFDPQNISTFYFGAQTKHEAWIGEFTLLKENDDDLILPTEVFADRLNSITCHQDSIFMSFKSKECYDYVSNSWSWVNQNASRKFTLVTAPGICDADQVRDPHHVFNVSFDEKSLTATMNTTRMSWKEVAEDFDFSTKHSYLDNNSQAKRKRQRRLDKTQTIDASYGPYVHNKLDKELDNVARLAEEMKELASNGTANSTDIDALQQKLDELEQKLETTMNEATEYILGEAESALETFVDDGDDPDLVKQAEDALQECERLSKTAESMYKKADVATNETQKEQFVADALDSEASAADALLKVLDNIGVSVGSDTDLNPNVTIGTKNLTRRSITRNFGHLMRQKRAEKGPTRGTPAKTGKDKSSIIDTAKSWWSSIKNGWTALKQVATAIVKVYEFINSDGPANLSWDEHWTPELYKTSRQTEMEWGMKFNARAIIDTKGKIVGQVDLGIRKRQLSKYNVDLRFEDVWASAQVELSTSGKLKKPLEVVPISKAIPLGTYQGRKIEIFGNNFLTIGPFVNVSLHAGFTELKGNGQATWGFKAQVQPNSSLILSADENIKNNLTVWNQTKITPIGPYVQSSMEGKLRTALVFATTFEATIFGEGANVTLEADLPSAGVAFRPQECNPEDKIKGIALRPYLGVRLFGKAAAAKKTWLFSPSMSKKLYEDTWSLPGDEWPICIDMTRFHGNVGDRKVSAGQDHGDTDGDGYLDDDELPAYDDESPPPYSMNDPFDVEESFFGFDDN